MNYYLIGFMGSGKSYWAEQIQKKLGLKVQDLDDMLTKTYGMSTGRYIFENGEYDFRVIESKMLKQLSQQKGLVLSCGGGTPLFNDNFSVMQQTGKIIYLKASPAFLHRNIIYDNTYRPLIGNKAGMGKLTELLEKRSKVYEQADHIIDVEHATIDTFAAILKL